MFLLLDDDERVSVGLRIRIRLGNRDGARSGSRRIESGALQLADAEVREAALGQLDAKRLLQTRS